MKRILFAFTAMICLATASFAQDKKADKAKAPAAAKAAPAAKKTEAPAKASPAAAPAAKPAAAPAAAGKMKADGTPDKRFKENKASAPAAGPLKKDGTPDMRYKANKDAAPKQKGESLHKIKKLPRLFRSSFFIADGPSAIYFLKLL